MGVIQYLTPLSYNYQNLKKKLPVINKKNLIDENKNLLLF